MRISIHGDDQVIEHFRHGTGIHVEWNPSVPSRGVVVLSPENEQEWEALKRAARELHQVLPAHTVRIDDDPGIKSDGHGGGELDGTRERDIFLFVSE